MTNLVDYSEHNNIATITLNDGDKNVLSPQMLAQINAALDNAEKSGAVIIITGTGSVFSAGFDLRVLRTGVRNAFSMLTDGFALATRLLSFPQPVVIACNGHAVAMGCFLLLCGDFRIGTRGDFRIIANEVELGMTMPFSAIEMCRQRLNPQYLGRVINQSECFNPDDACLAGFLDEVTEASNLMACANREATRLAGLDLAAHQATKLRFRRKTLRAMRWASRKDVVAFAGMGMKRMVTASKRS